MLKRMSSDVFLIKGSNACATVCAQQQHLLRDFSLDYPWSFNVSRRRTSTQPIILLLPEKANARPPSCSKRRHCRCKKVMWAHLISSLLWIVRPGWNCLPDLNVLSGLYYAVSCAFRALFRLCKPSAAVSLNTLAFKVSLSSSCVIGNEKSACISFLVAPFYQSIPAPL